MNQDILSSKSTSTQRLVGIKNGRNRSPHDYYITDPKAVKAILEREDFEGVILDPACGNGGIAKFFKDNDWFFCSDIRTDDDLYPEAVKGIDFLEEDSKYMLAPDTIIMNPPFNQILQFIKRALELADKVVVFGRIQLLEGKERYKFFLKNPPKRVYVFSNRISCIDPKTGWNAPAIMCFCWFVWEKGFKGEPSIHWILTDKK